MSFLLVITGTVISTTTRAGSLHATISIINVYKEGNLAIQQAGKNMSAKIIVVCKQCPLLRRGKYSQITALCFCRSFENCCLKYNHKKKNQ